LGSKCCPAIGSGGAGPAIGSGGAGAAGVASIARPVKVPQAPTAMDGLACTATPIPYATSCHGWACPLAMENQYCPQGAHGASYSSFRCCGGKWRLGAKCCGGIGSGIAVQRPAKPAPVVMVPTPIPHFSPSMDSCTATPIPYATSCHGWACPLARENQYCPKGVHGASYSSFRCCGGKWRHGSKCCGDIGSLGVRTARPIKDTARPIKDTARPIKDTARRHLIVSITHQHSAPTYVSTEQHSLPRYAMGTFSFPEWIPQWAALVFGLSLVVLLFCIILACCRTDRDKKETVVSPQHQELSAPLTHQVLRS